MSPAAGSCASNRSRKARRWAAGLAGIALVCGALAFAPASEESPPALTLEDVVRLFVDGTGPDAIIQRIESSPVDFDLSDEMLDELRLAGLPESVIEAMQHRQLELHPPAAPTTTPPDDTEPTAVAALTVHLILHGGATRSDDGQAVLQVADVVQPDRLQELHVRDPEVRITDVAIYVACLTATHVPDHWRGQSPLGRDFNSMQRHELLAFISGASAEAPGVASALFSKLLGRVPAGSDRAWQILDLAVPQDVALEIDPTEEHDLSIGVAVRIDDRFYRVASAEVEDFVPASHGGRLDVRIDAPKNLDPWSITVHAPA